jgi:hypothetical protein
MLTGPASPRRSAFGFGHARRDLAAGDPGGADAEEGPDLDSLDMFFSGLGAI